MSDLISKLWMQWNEKFDYCGAQLYVLYHAYVKIPL